MKVKEVNVAKTDEGIDSLECNTPKNKRVVGGSHFAMITDKGLKKENKCKE